MTSPKECYKCQRPIIPDPCDPVVKQWVCERGHITLTGFIVKYAANIALLNPVSQRQLSGLPQKMAKISNFGVSQSKLARCRICGFSTPCWILVEDGDKTYQYPVCRHHPIENQLAFVNSQERIPDARGMAPRKRTSRAEPPTTASPYER